MPGSLAQFLAHFFEMNGARVRYPVNAVTESRDLLFVVEVVLDALNGIVGLLSAE